MAPRVLRRNGRNNQKQRKRRVILSVIALAFALSGALHLSWALEGRSQHQAALSAQQEPIPSKIAPRPSDGALNGKDEDESHPSPSSDEADEETVLPEDAPEATANPEPAPSSERPSSTPALGPSEPAQATTIHHTKYREKPVYRIVHHQVSVAREVSVNGRPHIEWSLCPVCFQRHDAAYNERVLDRVDRVFCDACGERHASDYDETVFS